MSAKKPAAPRGQDFTHLMALHRIQKKLDKWELEHLRQHARHLADRVEELEEANAELRDRLSAAEDRAEWWREQSMALHDELAEVCHGVPGLTRNGELVVAKQEEAA